MVAAADQELHVCASSVLEFLQSTMSSLETAFQVPEFEAALSALSDEEDELKKKVEQCNADSESAIEQLDIEKAEQFDHDLQQLKQQLWKLVERKLDRVNQEEVTGRKHFLLEAEQMKSQIVDLSTGFEQLAALCANDSADRDDFGAQLNTFEQSQALIDEEQHAKHQTAADEALAECQDAEQKLQEAMLRIEKAYDHQNTVLKAQEEHQIVVEARIAAINQEREWLQTQLEDGEPLNSAAKGSIEMLGDCNGE